MQTNCDDLGLAEWEHEHGEPPEAACKDLDCYKAVASATWKCEVSGNYTEGNAPVQEAVKSFLDKCNTKYPEMKEHLHHADGSTFFFLLLRTFFFLLLLY